MSRNGISVKTNESGTPVQCTARYGNTSYVYNSCGDAFNYTVLHDGRPVNIHVLKERDLSPAVRKAFGID